MYTRTWSPITLSAGKQETPLRQTKFLKAKAVLPARDPKRVTQINKGTLGRRNSSFAWALQVVQGQDIIR